MRAMASSTGTIGNSASSTRPTRARWTGRLVRLAGPSGPRATRESTEDLFVIVESFPSIYESVVQSVDQRQPGQEVQRTPPTSLARRRLWMGAGVCWGQRVARHSRARRFLQELRLSGPGSDGYRHQQLWSPGRGSGDHSRCCWTGYLK